MLFEHQFKITKMKEVLELDYKYIMSHILLTIY